MSAIEWRDASAGHVITPSGIEPFLASVSGGEVWVRLRGRTYRIPLPGNASGGRMPSRRTQAAPPRAPMPGVILHVSVREGDRVSAGDIILTLEAMKIEHEVRAESAGRVAKLLATEGQRVEAGAVLAEIVPLEVEQP